MFYNLRKIWKPEYFQGNQKRKKYFEGWYFKLVNRERDHVLAIIPGISIGSSPGDASSFIQIIDGISGDSAYIPFPIDEFSFTREEFDLRFGKNRFYSGGIELDLPSVEYGSFEKNADSAENVHSAKNAGSAENVHSAENAGSAVSVPSAENAGSAVSVPSTEHGLKGSLLFESPVSYPVRFFSPGVMGWYRFTTYNASRITHLEQAGNAVEFGVKNKNYQLEVRAWGSGEAELRAPVSGEMSRTIKESIGARMVIRLSDRAGRLILEDTGKPAGMEVAGDTRVLTRQLDLRKG